MTGSWWARKRRSRELTAFYEATPWVRVGLLDGIEGRPGMALQISEPYRCGIGAQWGRILCALRVGRYANVPLPRDWRRVPQEARRLVGMLPRPAFWNAWQCEDESGLGLNLPARRAWRVATAERRMLTDVQRAALAKWRADRDR